MTMAIRMMKMAPSVVRPLARLRLRAGGPTVGPRNFSAAAATAHGNSVATAPATATIPATAPAPHGHSSTTAHGNVAPVTMLHVVVILYRATTSFLINCMPRELLSQASVRRWT